MNTINDKTIGILLSEASPPIRWRVEREILGRKKPETVSLEELLDYSRVRKNLDYLTGKAGFDSIHGSFNHVFENVCGRLHDLGIRQGMGDLDQKIEPYLNRLEYLVNSTEHGNNLYTGLLGKEFQASIIAGSLSLIGYHRHPVVRKHVKARLVRLAEFKPQFNLAKLYAPDPPGYPKVWRGRLPPKLHDMADEVAAWIMTDDYQSLPDGYGVITTSPRRYYAMGWSVKLPGWDRDFNPRYVGMMFQYSEVLASFKSASNHP